MAQKSKRGRKPNAFDYKLTAEHCSKQLADTKKAFVKAEKALAKAQQAHQELLSEVARLDMLDRSLRAVNDKTQPPQNIKYVYTYPTWVWNPPYNVPSYTIPNSGQWTFTTQPSTFQLGTLQGGQGYNTGTGVGSSGSLLTSSSEWQSPTVTCTLANGNAGVTLTNSCINTVQTTPCGGSSDNGTVLTGTGSGDSVQWANAPSDGSFVVDLTTHESYEEVPKKDAVLEETPELLNA